MRWRWRVKDGTDTYEDQAYEKLQMFLTALGQPVFREMPDRERKRVESLERLPML